MCIKYKYYSALKHLKHIFSSIFTTMVIAYLLVVTLVHIPFIQNLLAREVSTLVGEKLGTRVLIGRVDIGFLNRLVADDVMIYDKSNKVMIKAARMAVKIDALTLLKNATVKINSAQSFGFVGNFYKRNSAAQANYQFLLDSLASKDKSKKAQTKLIINSFIIRHGALNYDRFDIPHTSSKFNLNHLHIKDLSSHIIFSYFSGKYLSAEVKRMEFKESCGFELTKLKFNLKANKDGATLHNFYLELPSTQLVSKYIHLRYKYANGTIDMPSLSYDGAILPSQISFSDFLSFMPSLRNADMKLNISLSFDGTRDMINIHRLHVSTTNHAFYLNSDITANITRQLTAKAKIQKLHINTDEMTNTLSKSFHLNIPKEVKEIGTIDYMGQLKLSKKDISVLGNLASTLGNIKFDFQKKDNHLSLNLQSKNLKTKNILPNLKIDNIAGLSLVAKSTLDNKKINNAYIDATIKQITYNNHGYNNIKLSTTYSNDLLKGNAILNDLNCYANVSGQLYINKARKKADITASVRNVDLDKLHISNKWAGSKFSFNIHTDFDYQSMNNYTATASIDNFAMNSSAYNYQLEKIDIFADTRNLNITSDFGHIYLKGKYDIASILPSIKNAIHSKLPSLCPHEEKLYNNFVIDMNINESDWLRHLFKVPLTLNAPLRFIANVDDIKKQLYINASISDFNYDGTDYKNAILVANTLNDTLSADCSVRKVLNNKKDLDLHLSATAANNKLIALLKWRDNQSKSFEGSICSSTQFVKTDNGSIAVATEINPSDIYINDTIWNIKPSSILYENGNLTFNHFSIEHDKQHIRIGGKATKSLSDSITVDLQDIDVNYVLNLVDFHSVDFAGKATGKAHIKSVFYNPDAYAILRVNDFRFESGKMGTLYANVNWNKKEKQIDIAAKTKDEEKETIINGYVSPSRNYIDLAFNANNTNLEFLEGFCGSFMDNVDAQVDGNLRLNGPLNNINLTGKVIANGNLHIKLTNVTYALKNDTVTLIPDYIIFNQDSIYDRNGNIGILNGTLHHEHLTHLTYNLDINAQNLLCYDTHGYGDEVFYGTAFGTGHCSIKGGNGKIDMDIDITPEKNSFIEYNASSPESINSQNFITWNDKAKDSQLQSGTDSLSTTNAENSFMANIPSDFHINFIVNTTHDATLRVLMDRNTGDYIALHGHGVLRASYFNKGAFDMFGNYQIEDGIYKLTIQNIIKKTFLFQQGGSIVFGGDPYNAALNLKALYTINGVPLADLQIGNSFSSNNVRVDCLMNIKGTPQSPHVDFDIDMPTVNNDAKQMIRTIINSEEEMNQQVVYLLGVGRFYVENKNNASSQEEQQDQTSLAMQSLLSGTISQQINNLLGNIIKNNNWTLGANISTGTEGFNNAEYEGILTGHLLNNRLLINGQFGYRDNNNASTSFIGDFDISYQLLPNGNISLKVYNQTNDRYFTKSSLNTQGIGINLKKEFNSFMDIFRFRRKKLFMNK